MKSDLPATHLSEPVPLVEEQLRVSRRTVPTDCVRLRIRTRETQQQIQVPVNVEEITIDRVPIGRAVDRPQSIRQEGDTTIVPVHEEVLVVTRQLMLKEEIRLVRRTREQPGEPRTETLRREEIDIARDRTQSGS